MNHEKLFTELKQIMEVDPSLKPPKRWFGLMKKRISKSNPDYDAERVRQTIGSIWYGLSTDKKKEIRGREGKQFGSPKD